MSQVVLEMKDITKIYPNGVIANDKASLTVKKGEIHSIVGENGAGKTTLMKILFGLVIPDSGKISYDGEPFEKITPAKALSKGIGMVHQHFALADSLSVAENLVVGKEPKRKLKFDRKKAENIVNELSSNSGLHVDPKAIVRDVPIGMRQKLEILKILYRGAKLLILDEPTAVLTPQEVKELFEALKKLKADGYTIVFISHKLREVLKISDKITVMRQGHTVGNTSPEETNEMGLSKMIVGREVIFKVQKTSSNPGKKMLNISNLNYWSKEGKHVLKSLNLNVKTGEILGVAGVEGNGQRELVDVVAGLREPQNGHVFIDDKEVTGYRPKQIRDLGVAHIPEDRLGQGVAVEATIEENLIANRYDKLSKIFCIFTKKSESRTIASKLVDDLNIATNSVSNKVSTLSGGNIQKVVVARELSTNPKLILANQPTRGVDIGSIEFIHSKLVDASRNGAAVLMVSSELREILSLSDKLVVMYEGEIVAAFSNITHLTEEELGLYMLGIKKQDNIQMMECLL